MRLDMKIRQKNSASFACIAFCVLTIALGTLHAQTQDANRIEAPVMLNRDQASAILPPSVFFRGQSAPIQGRNSAGLRMTDGKLVLSAIVDTSGYSSALQQTYQAYLLTEVPLTIASQKLPPGAYGFGFVAGNMIVMDIGGNEILRVDINR